jgi:hypothetical protein
MSTDESLSVTGMCGCLKGTEFITSLGRSEGALVEMELRRPKEKVLGAQM